MITFLRLRPADRISDLGAATRRREGTTVVELPNTDFVAQALAGGILAVVADPTGIAPGYVVDPKAALELATDGVAGWRITIIHDDSAPETVLDALARSEAAFLRAGRSSVAAAARLCAMPGIDAGVSVYVNDVDEAVEAVAGGASDLLLRDWDTERLGALRAALDGNLVERTAFPIGLSYDSVVSQLDADAAAVYLHLTDGSGVARPRYGWAPGKSEAPSVPDHRISMEWADARWLTGSASDGYDGAAPAIRSVLHRSLDGHRPDVDQLELLLTARGDDVDAIAHVADQLRKRTNGDKVTYVVNRNINYTNQCYFKCGFCAFSKGPKSLNLRGDPYLLDLEEIVRRSREAWDKGATEVTLQGGIHPGFTGEFYLDVVKAIKAEIPGMHIHGFTPLEVWQGAETIGMGIEPFLWQLKESGLNTLPGTAAEILDDDVRKTLCPDKIRTSQWAFVMETAHNLGIRATSTIMFGHMDQPRNWANHFEVIRMIQTRTGGFTEMVPLPFVHMGAPIFLRGKARMGPTWDEVVLIHAVARIAFDGLIDNIQASWVKLGIRGAQRLLSAGCNDLGGTLMNENISRAAGASHGEEMTPDELAGAIAQIGRTPVLRNTLYEPIGVS
ncbi:MAG: 5-amino-6-(D-ribitylamino)uracil--L-tyrosine 4-hydroxyphenyl transferase CofH [Acidimicrobiia bacterium]|nr:5-amino-6-(D-ribitylamino)uracil--L-tyrosine 4-hydroxyphenyl transferase CofH [Acidimicrobiia bacterium]